MGHQDASDNIVLSSDFHKYAKLQVKAITKNVLKINLKDLVTQANKQPNIGTGETAISV